MIIIFINVGLVYLIDRKAVHSAQSDAYGALTAIVSQLALWFRSSVCVPNRQRRVQILISP